MCDTFKTSGKELDAKDKLTMFLMGVSNISRQDFDNLVSNGSRSQDLSWEEMINSQNLIVYKKGGKTVAKCGDITCGRH